MNYVFLWWNDGLIDWMIKWYCKVIGWIGKRCELVVMYLKWIMIVCDEIWKGWFVVVFVIKRMIEWVVVWEIVIIVI